MKVLDKVKAVLRDNRKVHRVGEESGHIKNSGPVRVLHKANLQAT